MKVYLYPEVYECHSAELHKDGVYLLNEDGSIIVIIASKNDIDSVEDGEIKVIDKPEPTLEERTAAVEEALALLLEGATE